MIHGPRSVMNLNAPCTKNGKCTKKLPKQFHKHTIIEYNFDNWQSIDFHFTFTTVVQFQMGNVTTGHWHDVPYNSWFWSTYNFVSMWCHAYQWKSSDMYVGMCVHKHTEATKALSLTVTLNLMQKRIFWQNCLCCWCTSWQLLPLSQKSWSTVLTKPTFTIPMSYLRGQGKAAQGFAATGIAVDLLKWSNRSHSSQSPYFHCSNICFWHANLVT
jgi:hypothetical protein